MYRTQFPQALVPLVSASDAMFLDWQDRGMKKRQFDKLIRMETCDSAFLDAIEFAGVGGMPVKQEAVNVGFDDPIQGGTKRVLMSSYGLAIRVSHELYKDDKINLVMQCPKSLAQSAEFSKEVLAFGLLNGGFTTTLTIDGLTLFHNQHPLLGGTNATSLAPGIGNISSSAGTYPNRPATDMDFSIAAIQLAVNFADRMINQRGFPTMCKYKYAVIPPELKFIAKEILGSAHKPYTSDNEVNALLSEDLMIADPAYLTSTTAWFLLPDKEDHKLMYYTREELSVDYADDMLSKSLVMMAYERKAAAALHWINTFGSNGP